MYSDNNLQTLYKGLLHPSFIELFKDILDSSYLKRLYSFLKERKKEVEIYPDSDKVWAAFNFPLKNLKVVVVGQDPYHTPGMANGLCFSSDTAIPPSLRNIFLELEYEYQGDKEVPVERLQMALEGKIKPSDIWGKHLTEQGVLLLNASLTVEKGKPNSHHKHWKKITKAIIEKLKEENEDIVWLIWGNFAKQLVGKVKYSVVTSHPSPLSARHSFTHSNCFKRVNTLLEKLNKKPIKWIQ